MICNLSPFFSIRTSISRASVACTLFHCKRSSHLAFNSARNSSGNKRGIGTNMANSEFYKFGPYKISPSEVFYFTHLSYAMVNLKPVIPGDVLICPRREVKRFVDLTTDETSDLWKTAKSVGVKLESYHKASSITFTIQDGPQAGQTVPHVHIHVLPRKIGDFEKNDEIYDEIDNKEKKLQEKLDLDKERKDRSYEEMAQEANEYRALFS
ncbi:Bis(5'-adenosyl)-triphosphatase [Zostera marina]|uniref:Bis(5'-adenosyl)-triphosphatase n=1 Tax=Zostera marina TaxID=29655 RepID=A0A0K9P4G9_ZOSMR|nr:Bis(5'-adenosyl)-triphosphatase [Zostera marina]